MGRTGPLRKTVNVTRETGVADSLCEAGIQRVSGVHKTCFCNNAFSFVCFCCGLAILIGRDRHMFFQGVEPGNFGVMKKREGSGENPSNFF